MFLLLLAWCSGFCLPLILPHFDGKSFILWFASYNYSLVCHQSSSSTVNFAISNLLVCTRCAGIYFGALTGAAVLLMISKKISIDIKLFVIFIIPLVFDALAIRIGLYPYSEFLTFLTGIMFGVMVILFIIEAIEKSFHLSKEINYDS